jgi:large repetitive protein
MFQFLTGAQTPTQARRRFRPTFDVLEARTVPAATFVRDINPGGPGSAPADLVAMNGQLFFTADDGIHGRELWLSNGTPGGTHLVKDINPGTTGSNPLYLTVVRTAVGNRLFFSADDGLRGRELWVSDGTMLGTHIARDINPGPADSEPTDLVAFKHSLFFAANDGLHGRELWRSDGTRDGTFIVRDINLGPASSTPKDLTVANFTRLNGTTVDFALFFRADDGIHGAELWSTNGSFFGTVLVKDINPGPHGSNPFNITEVDPFNLRLFPSSVFFGADDGVRGAELWRAVVFRNGAVGGARLVKDINPGPASSLQDSPTTLMAKVNRHQLFFAADNGFLGQELWKSNGFFAGTQLVQDINPGPASSNPTAQQHPLPPLRNLILNGVLFFGANDGFFGGELWRTDGVPANTFRVLDINTGPPSALADNKLIGAVFNNNIFFAANNGDNVFNTEPWRSNGDPLGTRLVQDINAGSAASAPSYFTVVGNTLFLAADNGLFGRELWKIP